MSLIVKETAGDSLIGVINGSNKAFETSFDYASEFVLVYQNGILLQADLETGYNLIPPRTIVLKEAPQIGPDDPDTLEVEYRAVGVKTGGGALGGCPPPMKSQAIAPTTNSMQDKPKTSATGMGPSTLTQQQKPSTGSGQVLVPRILGSKDC